ncbi:MAG: phosphotransferase [marine bacterium B5-7]|nr:MAG: phosphotransferase [marine bacterium B5-7]
MTDQRQQQCESWVHDQMGACTFMALPVDASFRRYFRVKQDNQTWIVMDAPPEKEDCHPFVAITQLFLQKNVNVPSLVAQDLEQGFLLLTDFGDDLLGRLFSTIQESADRYDEAASVLYRASIDMLLPIQQCSTDTLQAFDAGFMQKELDHFNGWFIEKYLQLDLTPAIKQTVQTAFKVMIQSAEEQPPVCIHRDYHSRNLLLTPDNAIGVIDFQDAMSGPITYDVVSLLRDCYVDWPDEQVMNWFAYYIEEAERQGVVEKYDRADWIRWFDLMGVQRHLKAIFIFARKSLRDNDDRYLPDIRRALYYVNTVLPKYPALAAFTHFMAETVTPLYEDVTV